MPTTSISRLRLVAVLLAATATCLLAACDPGSASVLGRINSQRAARGLTELTVNPSEFGFRTAQSGAQWAADHHEIDGYGKFFESDTGCGAYGVGAAPTVDEATDEAATWAGDLYTQPGATMGNFGVVTVDGTTFVYVSWSGDCVGPLGTGS